MKRKEINFVIGLLLDEQVPEAIVALLRYDRIETALPHVGTMPTDFLNGAELPKMAPVKKAKPTKKGSLKDRARGLPCPTCKASRGEPCWMMARRGPKQPVYLPLTEKVDAKGVPALHRPRINLAR